MSAATRTHAGATLRPMREEDLAQVADIERESFSSAWPQTTYMRELHNSVARYFVLSEPLPPGEATAADGPVSVWQIVRRRFARAAAEHNAYVLGFIGLWLTVGEAHVVTFAVREAYRRLGIGERLLLAAFDCAIANDQGCLTLEVRASNDAAKLLYEKYGLRAEGLRKRYYSDNNEDAVIMTSPPLADAAFRARLDRLRSDHRTRHPDQWA